MRQAHGDLGKLEQPWGLGQAGGQAAAGGGGGAQGESRRAGAGMAAASLPSPPPPLRPPSCPTHAKGKDKDKCGG